MRIIQFISYSQKQFLGKITTQGKRLNQKKKYLKKIQETVKVIKLISKVYYYLNQLLEFHFFSNDSKEILDFLFFIKDTFMKWF